MSSNPETVHSFASIKSFADVDNQNGINTEQFLEASKGVVVIFETLGSVAFSIVINDMKGNIAKLEKRFNEAKEESLTLESIVKNECKGSMSGATQGLCWLLRGFSFTHEALKNTHNDKSKTLSQAFTDAYNATLIRHHNVLIKPLFKVAMKACPDRESFFDKLMGKSDEGQAISQDSFDKDLTEWLGGLKTILDRLENLHEHGICGEKFQVKTSK